MGSTLYIFRAGCLPGGTQYKHVLFHTEDDRVECQDMGGRVILTYDANCAIWKDGEVIAHSGMARVEGDTRWVFTLEGEAVGIPLGPSPDLDPDALIKAEVEFTKLYLRTPQT